MLESLLEFWPLGSFNQPAHYENAMQNGGMSENGTLMNGSGDGAHVLTRRPYFHVPEHTPVIFSEVNGRTLFRMHTRDASGEIENILLKENVPQWVYEIVVEVRFVKNNSS